MQTESDGQLVARTRRGDLVAFEEIVTRHRAALLALAAARLGSLAEAEDVAQEAFVQAFFHLHHLDHPEVLLSWLRLDELDWQLDDVNMLANTLGRPVGRGEDMWGIPLSRQRIHLLDARDICRRLHCDLLQLYIWVQHGCPTVRCYPFVRFDPDRVRQWLADQGITDWPHAEDRDTNIPIRVIFRELHRGAISPEYAEEVYRTLAWI